MIAVVYPFIGVNAAENPVVAENKVTRIWNSFMGSRVKRMVTEDVPAAVGQAASKTAQFATDVAYPYLRDTALPNASHVVVNNSPEVVSKFVMNAALPFVKTNWKNIAIGVGILYGIDSIYGYIPGTGLLAHAATSTAGSYVYSKSEGLRRYFSDLNEMSKKGGAIEVTRTMARNAVGAAGEGVRIELLEPFVENKIKPIIKNVENKLDPLEKNTGELLEKIKGGFWSAFKLVAAGTLTYFGGRLLYNYLVKQMNKPRLDVIHKKAPGPGMEERSRLRPMVFKDSVKKQVNHIFESTLAIRNSIQAGMEGVTYKNILLYGPPGSGKKMLAEQIAARAHMDFYDIPKSSFMKLNEIDLYTAIEQFFNHELLKSTNGSVVYIENAHVLFSSKNSQDATVSLHRANLISCIIEQAEKRTSNCMIVFGMDELPSLNSDTMLIVDEIIEFGLPEKPERIMLLSRYRDLYFNDELSNPDTAIHIQAVLNPSMIDFIADKLNKASAAELAAFMKTLKIESDMPESGLSKELINTIIDRTDKKNASFVS